MELDPIRLEEASHLEGMRQSPGWKIVEDEAVTRIAKLTKLLVWSDDQDKTRELQANIRSLEFLLTFPLQMMEAAQKAIEKAKEASQTDSASNGESKG